ncbi:unnamed protein product [Camellia sinensis]
MGIAFTRLFSSLFGNREARILVLGLDNAGKTTILYRLQMGGVVSTIPSCDMRAPVQQSKIRIVIISLAIFSKFQGTKMVALEEEIKREEYTRGAQLTIGFNVETVQYNNIKFQVWDLGIQEIVYFVCCWIRNFLLVSSSDSGVLGDTGGQTSIRAQVSRPYWRCYFPNTQAIIYVVDSSDTDRLVTAKDEFHAILEEEELKGAVVLIFANKQTGNVMHDDLPGALDDAAVTEALELHRIKNRQWAIFKTSAIKGEGLFEGLDCLEFRHINMKLCFLGNAQVYAVEPKLVEII